MGVILAVDPGVTTGIARLYDGKWKRWHLEGEHYQELYELATVADEIVCESFFYRQGAGSRRKVQLESAEYIGVLKLVNQMYQIPLTMQTPAMGKNFWADDKIKALDLWIPGMVHAMDATRHLLYYLMTKKKDSSYVKQLKLR